QTESLMFHRYVIHEIAADVVRRARKEPDVPFRDLWARLRHQGLLDRTAGRELVTGHQLVLELEHQDEDQRCDAKQRKKNTDGVRLPLSPDMDPLQHEKNAQCQKTPPGWRELEKEARQQP